LAVLIVPKITSNRWFSAGFSYRRTSKVCVADTSANSTVRHSMLKMRSGAVPETEVKMPHPVAQV